MFTFSNPLLFWFFPVLALPWIFRRRKEERIKHIRFPLLKFLQESQEKELVNPYLQELLLLILRTLLIALLLLALAGPRWVTGDFPGQSLFSFLPIGKSLSNHSIVIDTSYSMRYGEGDDSWWRKAYQAWNTVDAETKGFSTKRYRWDRSTVSSGQATRLLSLSSREIEELFLGMPTEEGTSILSLSTALQQTLPDQSSVILVTDGQRWPWLPLLNQSLNRDELPSLVVVPVGEKPVRNTWFHVESLSSPPWGISGWETIAGSVLSIQGEQADTGSISIFHSETGDHLYSKPVAYPASGDDVAVLPFSFTALFTKLLQENSQIETGDDLTFTIKVEPFDSLSFDNEMTIRVPVSTRFTYGLACKPLVDNQARSIMASAMNPLAGTEDSPPVQVVNISPPITDFPPDIDLLFVVHDFAQWWSNQETMSTVNYIKNGGSAVVFVGDRGEEGSYWDRFLTELGWTWFNGDAVERTGPVSVADSDLFSHALSSWESSMWEPWIPEQSHGVTSLPNARPLVAYPAGETMASLITDVPLGKGRVWLINTALDEKSEVLLSPILPVLIWEAAKEVARTHRESAIAISKPREESNLVLLSEEDKQALQNSYNIRFATKDTVKQEINRIHSGIDLRLFLLFLCVVLALVESWLSNRLASM